MKSAKTERGTSTPAKPKSQNVVNNKTNRMSQSSSDVDDRYRLKVNLKK